MGGNGNGDRELRRREGRREIMEKAGGSGRRGGMQWEIYYYVIPTNELFAVQNWRQSFPIFFSQGVL